MTAPITNWYDEVLPLIPGVAPGPLALGSIIRAVIDLCQKAKVWEMDHPAISLVADTASYAFAPGAGMQVVQPLNVWVSDLEINPGSPSDFDASIPTWRTVSSAPAQGYYLPDEDHIAIVPTPSAAITDGLTMRVAVKPTAGTTAVLDRFWDHLNYRDAIRDGALADLYDMTGLPWSNPDAAAKYQDKFNGAIGRFDLLRAKGRTRRPTRSYVVHGVK